MFPDTTEENVLGDLGLSVAVGNDDNVYAIGMRYVRKEDGGAKHDFVLHVSEENYDMKNVSVLNFACKDRWSRVNIAVDKNQNLIILTHWNNQVYVCDNTGKLKFQFERDGGRLSLSISNNNDIMTVTHDRSAILTYSTDGELKSTIKVPDGHEAYEVAFHHSICKIIVLARVREEDSYFLLSYSETGELENSVFFCKKEQRVKL